MSSRKLTSANTEPITQSPFTVGQVVAGLELGETDAALLDYLDFFAGHFSVAAAHFIHVAPRFDLVLDSEILNDKYKLSQAIVQNLTDTVAARLTPNRIPVIREAVREGSPLEELLEEAQTATADLILIGQKSLAENHGILAKKLARRADCNLLVVPSAAKRTLRKLLVPIDFSAHAARALQTAVAMNRQLDQPAEIVALHVYEMPDFSAFTIGKTEEQFRHMIESDRREALTAFIETHVPADQLLHLQREVLLKARPGIARYVLDYARTQDVDFLIMGARGHSRIHLLFVGSVTENVLSDNKTIPTFIVR